MARGLRGLSWQRIRRHLVPAGVWLCVLAAVVLLLERRSGSFLAVGVARGRVEQVSAVTPGRIAGVQVNLFDRVQAGQVLARIDDGPLAGQAAAILAEMDRLRAEHDENRSILEADVANRHSEWVAEHRAFCGDTVTLTLHVHELRTTLETDRVLLADLEREVENTRALVEQEAVPAYELAKACALADSLARKVDQTQAWLTQAEVELAQARERMADYENHLPVLADEQISDGHLQQAVAVQAGLLAEVEALRRDQVLRAPFDGVVVEIQPTAGEAALRRTGEGAVRATGEVVVAGEPVLTIAAERPEDVVAYAPDDVAEQLHVGMEVELATLSQPVRRARTQVVAVGPTVERMPERLWPGPALPAWGRPFLVAVPPELALRPGEVVHVRRPR